MTTIGVAQETVERNNDLSVDVQEHYSVLKDDKKVKHGFYRALRDGKVMLASGHYDHGVRTGIWHFYDRKGMVTQHYDYTHKQLIYNRVPDTVMVKFDFGIKLNPGDSITYPVKIGGVTFGYFNLMNGHIDAMERDMHNLGRSVISYRTARIFTIGADGLINKYQVLYILGDTKKLYDVDINTLSDDDKLFIPATHNGQPIASTGYFQVSTTREF